LVGRSSVADNRDSARALTLRRPALTMSSWSAMLASATTGSFATTRST
jgi:hypothetical protein